jgi:transposase-like protein
MLSEGGSMHNGRRKLSAKEKFEIVKEGLLSGATVSEICRRNSVHSSQYYTWQNKFFEGAKEGLKQRSRGRNGDSEEDRLQRLLRRKDSVIAEITTENLTLKKSIGE